MHQRVQQAIALLPMATADLNDYVQNQLDENPFLMIEPSFRSFTGSTIDVITNTLADKPSVMDDVIRQFYLRTMSEHDRTVGMWIIHHLDERGFFSVPIDEAVKLNQTNPQHVHQVLAILQSLEPMGVASTGVAHYWRLQLAERKQLTPELDQFLQHIEKLNAQSLVRVAKTLGCSLDVCQSMLQKLRRLKMYPFEASDHVDIRIPDVLTERNDQGDWYAYLNEDVLPQILVNNTYLSDIKPRLKTPEDKAFVRDKVEHARWLVRALQERAHNLISVSACLLQWQQGYWLNGEEAIEPLTLKDIADKTGLHVSTISRITSHKCIQTPFGVKTFKHFFSRSLVAMSRHSYSNVGASSQSIQHQLRKFVQNEPPHAPFSDDHLFNLFQMQGVGVARRTLNKYRQRLNIPSSSERKRLYALGARSLF